MQVTKNRLIFIDNFDLEKYQSLKKIFFLISN